MKRIMSLLMAFALAALMPITASAEKWVGVDFAFEAPEGLYRLGPNTDENDPVWALAKISDPSSKLKEYRDMGVLVNFLDGNTDIVLMQKESDQAKQVFDIRLLDEGERASFLEKLASTENQDVTLDKSWYENGNGLLFYRLQIDIAGQQEMHELIYGTIMNGYSLNMDIHTVDAGISREQMDVVQGMIESMEFTNIQEKPPEDPSSAVYTLLLMLLMIAAVVGPLVYMPIRTKRDKKKKARLTEQLTEFHKTHGKDAAQGEAVFINQTDCTREAIRRFSYYQTFVKNIGEVVFGVLLCAVTVCGSFLIDAVWWMKLAAVAVTVYYAYKLIAMPGAVEKIQTKVHSQGMSKTAHYSFYPDVLRVSGIQSANVVPYFQIADVRKCGQYLYLYYGPDNAYMVDMYGFAKGEAGEFEKFIREKTRK